MANPLLSVVIPVYCEEACVERLVAELAAVLEPTLDYEIVLVDDGSQDRTVDLLKVHAAANPRLKLVCLSYNYGKEVALTAGVRHARGDLILFMDADLQDPPVEIPRMVEKAREGYDLVLGVREEKKDSLVNRALSAVFWRGLEVFTGLQFPRSLAVMRIFNRRFADQFLQYHEANRFIEGLFMDIRMRWTTLVIRQQERYAGTTKFTFGRRLRLATRAVLSHSELPLALTVRFGLVMVLLSAVAGVTLIVLKLFFIEFQAGWPSLFVVLVLGFGLQILFLGLVGAYVGNIYREVKRRPLFSVKELVNLDDPATSEKI